MGDEEENTNVGLSATLPRCSGRVSRELDRYLGFEPNVVALDASDDDPPSFNDAMVDLDKDKWLEAKNQEIESMQSNSVWTLVDAPEQIRPIGCKWIYKGKKGVDGQVETYEARLVAKGFTQIEGIDYDKSFSGYCRSLGL